MSSRMSRILPEQMDQEQAELYAELTGGNHVHAVPNPSGGGLTGPPSTWLLSPQLGRAFRQTYRAIRNDTLLTPRCREIAILLHAAHRNSEFELHAHRLIGVRDGLSTEDVERLVAHTPPEGMADEERLVFDTALALVTRKELTDEEYAQAVEGMGERKLFELLSVIGFFDLLATQLSVFGVTPPAQDADR